VDEKATESLLGDRTLQTYGESNGSYVIDVTDVVDVKLM
jgi:hypothetical protein